MIAFASRGAAKHLVRPWTLFAVLLVPLLGPSPATPAVPTGSWGRPVDMLIGRYHHTATRLLDGRVLVTGGRSWGTGANLRLLSESEIFDPAIGTWEAGPPMSIPRADHTATLLNDGRVLVTGGTTGTGCCQTSVDSTELYDPATGTWSAGPPMPREISGHLSARLADGRVLVSDWSNATLIYDPDIGGWSSGPSVPASFEYASVGTLTELHDGRVLATMFPNSTRAYVLDLSANTWAETAPMPISGFGGMSQATRLRDGHVLVVHVRTSSSDFNQVTNAVALYDPASNAWRSVSPPATQRSQASLAPLANGNVLIAGGWNVLTWEEEDYLSSAEELDITTDHWKPAGDMGTGRTAATATALDGKVLLVGGSGFTGAVSTSQLYGVLSPPRLIAPSESAITADGNVTFIGLADEVTESIEVVLDGARIGYLTKDQSGWTATFAIRDGQHAAYLIGRASPDQTATSDTVGFVVDATKPRSTITTTSLNVAVGKVRGSAFDATTGVAGVSVSFRRLEPPARSSTVEAVLVCSQDGVACTWTADTPLLPGSYEVRSAARDVAGNIETDGPAVVVIVL